MKIRLMLFIPAAKKSQARQFLKEQGLLRHINRDEVKSAWDLDEEIDLANPSYYAIQLNHSREQLKKLNNWEGGIPKRLVVILEKHNWRNGEFICACRYFWLSVLLQDQCWLFFLDINMRGGLCHW